MTTPKYTFLCDDIDDTELSDFEEFALIPSNIFLDNTNFPNIDNLLDALILLNNGLTYQNFLSTSSVTFNGANSGTGSFATVFSFQTQSVVSGTYRFDFDLTFDYEPRIRDDYIEFYFEVDGVQLGEIKQVYGYVARFSTEKIHLSYFYHQTYTSNATHLIECRARVIGRQQSQATVRQSQATIAKKG